MELTNEITGVRIRTPINSFVLRSGIRLKVGVFNTNYRLDYWISNKGPEWFLKGINLEILRFGTIIYLIWLKNPLNTKAGNLFFSGVSYKITSNTMLIYVRSQEITNATWCLRKNEDIFWMLIQKPPLNLLPILWVACSRTYMYSGLYTKKSCFLMDLRRGESYWNLNVLHTQLFEAPNFVNA